MTWTVGVETGGTFTDLLMIGPEGQVVLEKALSTPRAPEEAVMAALERGLGTAGIAGSQVGRLLHGSTLAANALIERSAALPALITTRGFRDLLLIQRQDKTRIYDMFYRKPRPLIDRDRIHEVTERLAADGSVVTPLDRAEVLASVERIVVADEVRSIAVCLLHSYANPAHERAIAAWIAERYPTVQVTLSSDVCPVHREYERMSTTVTSAYLRPVVATYLERIEARVAEAGCPAAPLIMQSNGGVLPVGAVGRNPAGMYLSGPAAAVKGAQFLAANGGPRSLITLDVGGTSCDICLITDGEAAETGHGGVHGTVHGLPLDLVRTDIVTIGAGGGSLAWLDAGGMLCVGPRSAGADPGPACYGRGGTGFTLTDAMVVLGLLPEGRGVVGGLTLSRVPAEAAAAPLAAAMETDVLEVARAVYRVAVANIARAIRGVTVQRGFDPRDYALFACGGAGPLLAVPVAEEMGIGQVMVPPHPGVFSAFGLLVAGLRMDYVADTGGWSTDRLAAEEVVLRLSALVADAVRDFAAVGVDRDALELRPSVDARYPGQGYELRVPLDAEALRSAGPAHIAQELHARHARRYGHAFRDQPVEVVNLRLEARSAPPLPGTVAVAEAEAEAPAPGRRRVRFGGADSDSAVIGRGALASGREFAGPALIGEATTTTLLPAGWVAQASPGGPMQLRREAAR